MKTVYHYRSKGGVPLGEMTADFFITKNIITFKNVNSN